MLSVLIVNWNTRDLLRACLSSIELFPPKVPLEVIVVDNDSTDGSAEMVQSEFPSVKLIKAGTNIGYAMGNNLASNHANGVWLLTLNPDTEVFAGSLQLAVDELAAKAHYGCLGARLIGVDGKVQKSVRGFPTLVGIFGDVTKLGKLLPRSALGSYRLPAFDYEKAQDAPQPMGTFLLFRKEALEAVGDAKHPFDEEFPIFFNEVDLLYRMKLAGWPCWYSPNVEIRHHGGEGTKQVRKRMIWESHRSLVRFLRKHNRSAWNAPLLMVVSAFVYVAAFVRARGWDAGFRT